MSENLLNLYTFCLFKTTKPKFQLYNVYRDILGKILVSWWEPHSCRFLHWTQIPVDQWNDPLQPDKVAWHTQNPQGGPEQCIITVKQLLIWLLCLLTNHTWEYGSPPAWRKHRPKRLILPILTLFCFYKKLFNSQLQSKERDLRQHTNGRTHPRCCRFTTRGHPLLQQGCPLPGALEPPGSQDPKYANLIGII